MDITPATSARATAHATESTGHLALHTPVQYDRALVAHLLAAHEALNARFAVIVCDIEREPAAVADVVRRCAEQLHDLRRSEAIWLYPVIASGVDADAAARRQLLQLRLSMLTHARRTLRLFDELSSAIENGAAVHPLIDELSTSLAEYLHRSEREIHPLYTLVGTRRAPRAAQVA